MPGMTSTPTTCARWSQRYPDWQLCICDDASTREDVRAMLKRAAANDAPVAQGSVGAGTRAVAESHRLHLLLDQTPVPGAVEALLHAERERLGLDFLRWQPFNEESPDPTHQLPASVLAGAALLLFADLIARLALAPAELPIGIVTAFLGAPFFLYLLLRGRH